MQIFSSFVVFSGPFSVWQQKEEETMKLRESLEQQKQEAKSREAELLAGASKNVGIIFCVMSTIIYNTVGDVPMFLFR